MAALILTIVFAGNPILLYIDLPSIILVFVGSYVTLFSCSSISDVLGIFKTISLCFKNIIYDEKSIITKLVAMSEKARRDGLLALEEDVEDIDDEFIKMGLSLIVDGTDAAVIRDVMGGELSQMQERHANKIAGLNLWGTLGPAVGMMGTVIGLIAMLRNLDDKDALGPNMAVAMITTLYGSMLANFMMIPWSTKLKSMDSAEVHVKEMIIEGVLSIQAGDNTRILALKLLSYLNPKDRRAVEATVLKD
jgi:chemotaxis protein MotA